jgi:hypothetical protein
MLKKILLILAVLVLLLLVAFAAWVYSAKNSEDVAFLNEVRYETGEHRGAEFCGSCHQEIYQQWRNHSRHAVATTADSVRDVISNLKEHTILNYVLGGEDMCYACHGPKEVNEGINCETCHGPTGVYASIEEAHELKLKPRMEQLLKEDFCAACHEIPGFVTPYSDWQKSVAASNGINCQSCHMVTPEGGIAYHGFNSFVLNQQIYDGDLELTDIRLDFPVLNVTIENHLTGHSIPAGGPTRILALEVSFLDREGDLIHRDMKTFAKYHSLMPVLGFWPNEVIADTTLKSLEHRPLSFLLPSKLEGRVFSVELLLRFYEVADEHAGNIEKAHYVSKPILEKRINNLPRPG